MSGSEQQAFTFGGGQRPSAVQMAESGRPLRRNKVLEAGAGTGKTTAIVAEVLHLLLSPDEVAPERIILVTFTEKAAGEIADRIEKALNEKDGAKNTPRGTPQRNRAKHDIGLRRY